MGFFFHILLAKFEVGGAIHVPINVNTKFNFFWRVPTYRNAFKGNSGFPLCR